MRLFPETPPLLKKKSAPRRVVSEDKRCFQSFLFLFHLQLDIFVSLRNRRIWINSYFRFFVETSFGGFEKLFDGKLRGSHLLSSGRSAPLSLDRFPVGKWVSENWVKMFEGLGECVFCSIYKCPWDNVRESVDFVSKNVCSICWWSFEYFSKLV